MDRMTITVKGWEIEVGDTVEAPNALDPTNIRFVTLLALHQETKEGRSFTTADSFVIVPNQSNVRRATP